MFLESCRVVIGALAGTTLAAIGGVHVAWAAGLRWGLIAAVPSEGGRPLFRPSAPTTLLVAIALFAAAWLTFALAGLVPSPVSNAWLWPAGVVAALVFAARAVGDFRYVGLFKRVRGSKFARQDDALFTPLCFALCTAIMLQL